ncbi:MULTISPECIES: cellulose biosynthesis protein BcsF [Rahnella]|jgi:cellulose biosynthesis operon protein BcsF/YhjT|uniref:Cellulose biosynthesis protein BcsF n=1 Tax=Rahnella victoriana TaxID=1510570 RepID=A0ABS0DPG9_9GAMM|nr:MULTISPECIES: cellulose biosynthesis protein BcsF [Rahnella]PKB90191.1 celllulose biosynthesis operon protein BcsF/YhjT [Ewingella americana]VTQ53014.1 celllulose biosynthesis operon protein BcsF/YhjT [Campylobacter jejuni]MBF7955781.1 cellulose biosynthesis protein BcsF [Rahnella victoriana]PBI79210.1 celllulose biosynthesis operon protein BcsF/YhjT [Rahnella victoriana]TBX32126.1 cellulose biosynthesis protein BcsF [Rahnella victoriana]
MDIQDIIEIFILAAVIFIPAGYALRSRLPRWKNRFATRFLSPRYLTPMTASMINKKRSGSPKRTEASPATGNSKTSL